MPIGISKEKYYNNYKKPALKYISDITNKEYPNFRQSICSKIAQLEKEYKNEQNQLKKLALNDVIKALKQLK